MRPRFVLGALAAALAGAAVAVGVVAANDDDGNRSPGRVGRLTQLEQTGEMHDLLERHRRMLQQMQDNASPAMLELMNNDPMWQMMRSPEWARLDEEHQADIDRMLGRGQP